MNPTVEQKKIIDFFLKDNKNKQLSVEAPPGTGKTYTSVMTCINYIRNKKYNNEDYNKKTLIITFSKNARGQINNQIDRLVLSNPEYKRYIKNIEVSNYHSFFKKYVWAYSEYLNLGKNLSIVSSKQAKKIYDDICKDIKGYEIEEKSYADQYKWMDSLLEDEYIPRIRGSVAKSVKNLLPYKEFIINEIKEKNKEGYIGFSDIAYYMNELLIKSPLMLEIIREKYDLVIIDEYQDISDSQDRIMKLIIGDGNALFFSDSKQMIYGWRGASNERVQDLKKEYKNIKELGLSNFMRFGDKQDLTSLIKSVRENDDIEIKDTNNIEFKVLKVEKNDQYITKTRNDMWSKLKYFLLKDIKKYKNEYESIGILCRNNELVKYLRKGLIENGTYIKCINNSQEDHDLIVELSSFLDNADYLNLDESAKFITFLIFEVIFEVKIGGINKKNINDIDFGNYKRAKKDELKEIKDVILIRTEKKEFINMILECLNIVRKYGYSIDWDKFNLLTQILKYKKTSNGDIKNYFLQYQQTSSLRNPEGIYILNIHQSKGKEFDVVYVIDYEKINDEKNLLYVSISRVKEKLIMTKWSEF